MSTGRLYYGDNLDILRERVADESVDLIYLDPPFNSNRNYNVIFSRRDTVANANQAQIQAFEDTWRWSPETDWQFTAALAGGVPNRVAEVLTAMRSLLGENDAMAYLTNMAPRLVELHRVLKMTGSIYLHCDPTMSHYLKVLMDAIFGPEHLRNEIIWKRTSAHSSAKKYGPIHDVVLYYAKSDRATWNQPRAAYEDAYLDKYYKYNDGDGRLYWRNSLTAAGTRNGSSGQPWRGIDIAATGQHWKFTTERLDELDANGVIYWPPKGGFPQIKRYRDELQGLAVGDIWTDIDKINPVAAERLGYPTQKPVALLERIVAASSNPGDFVLDPFCGCGTTIDAAIRLERQWTGIDIAYIAVDLIEKRLEHTFGTAIRHTYEVHGIPGDTAGAIALFNRSPFEFERWAVSLMSGTPNAKQVGDRGIDGVIRFLTDTNGSTGKALVSVKGGQNVNPSFVRDLGGTVEAQKAQMGFLTTMVAPTRGMLDAVAHAGTYTWPVNGQVFPRLQLVTVPDLLAGKKPPMPTPLRPYIAAGRHRVSPDQAAFDI